VTVPGQRCQEPKTIFHSTHSHHFTTAQKFRRQSDQQGAVTRFLRTHNFHAMMVTNTKEMDKAQGIALDKCE